MPSVSPYFQVPVHSSNIHRHIAATDGRHKSVDTWFFTRFNTNIPGLTRTEVFKLARFCKRNPVTAAVIVCLAMASVAVGVVLTVVGVVVAGPGLVVLVLSGVGFTAGGIAAGEIL